MASLTGRHMSGARAWACAGYVIVLFVLEVLSLTSDFSVVHSSGDRLIIAHILAPGWETKQEAAQSFGSFCVKLSEKCRSPQFVSPFVDFTRKSSISWVVVPGEIEEAKSKTCRNVAFVTLTSQFMLRWSVAPPPFFVVMFQHSVCGRTYCVRSLYQLTLNRKNYHEGRPCSPTVTPSGCRYYNVSKGRSRGGCSLSARKSTDGGGWGGHVF